MSISLNKSFVLKTSTGALWRFFLSPESNIVYCQLDSQPECQIHNPLLDWQQVKDFSATIDSSDNIHVLAYTTANQLIYCHWDGLKWQYQTVESLRSSMQSIPYLAITAYLNTIHVLYQIKGSSKSNTEMLTHYRWNGNKWIKQRTWTLSPNNFASIENLFVDNLGNIHLLFSQHQSHQTQLFYSCFSPSFSSWATPVAIYKLDNGCSDFYLYADSQNLHIIWKEKEDNGYVIKYLQARNGLQARNNIQESKIIYSGQEEPILPTLLLLKDLYCLWKMKNDIYFISSKDGGNTWSSPTTIPRTSSDNLTFFYYTSFDKPNLPPTLRLWSINYKGILDLHDSLEHPSLQAIPPIPDKKNDQQPIYAKLEKKIAEIEQQLDNITSALYAFQEQLLQNSKSVYFLEAMIKKLNFQVEQLRASTKQTFYNGNIGNKEKKPDPPKEQASQTPPIIQTSENTPDNYITPPSPSTIKLDDDITAPDPNSRQTTMHPNGTEQPPCDLHSKLKNTSDNQTPQAMQSPTTPQRISLGNVDIIVNSQEES